jgi:hypothetical protein
MFWHLFSGLAFFAIGTVLVLIVALDPDGLKKSGIPKVAFVLTAVVAFSISTCDLGTYNEMSHMLAACPTQHEITAQRTLKCTVPVEITIEDGWVTKKVEYPKPMPAASQ